MGHNQKIAVEILRSGKQILIESVMEEELSAEILSDEKFGLTVITTVDGVLVIGIKEGTFRGNREIEICDLIKKVNNKEVKYAPDFKQEIEKTAFSAQMLVERGNTTKSVTVSRNEKIGIGVFFPYENVKNGNYIPGFTLKFPSKNPINPNRFDFLIEPVRSIEFEGINYEVTNGTLIDINFIGFDFWLTNGPVIPYFSLADNFHISFGTQTIGSYGCYKMGVGMQGKFGLEVVLDFIGFFVEGGGGFNFLEGGQYKNFTNVEIDFSGFTGYYLLNFGTNFYF